jgi:hypothetical protein
MGPPVVNRPIPSRIDPIQKPIPEKVDPVEPVAAPETSKTDASRAIDKADPPASSLPTSQNSIDRSGALVDFITIDLDSNRVALESPQGGPLIRGTVSTDLKPGLYTVTVDIGNKRWVFKAGEVRGGFRFGVNLVGVVDPFSLVYGTETPLLVSGQPSGSSSALQRLKQQIIKDLPQDGPKFFNPDIAALEDVFEIFDSLNNIDLYDLMDELWLDTPGVINSCLINFDKVRALDLGLDMFRILRALESFAVIKKDLYVDTFDDCSVDPKSWKKDPVRELMGKTTLRLKFTYFRTPERCLYLYGDDIVDDPTVPTEPPTYGEGGLLYPKRLSLGSTPRMYAAKKKVLADIETDNLEIYMISLEASMTVINMTLFASSKLVEIFPAAGGAALSRASQGLKPRLVSDHPDRVVGRWQPDPQYGTNMSEAAAEYEAKTCNKPPRIGFSRNDVQFDGIEYPEKKLLEAKYWLKNQRQTKGLRAFANNPDSRFGNAVKERILSDAYRQLGAADGWTLEYRVASVEARDLLKQLFVQEKLPIEVIYVAP